MYQNQHINSASLNICTYMKMECDKIKVYEYDEIDDPKIVYEI